MKFAAEPDIVLCNAVEAVQALASGNPALVWRKVVADCDTPVGAARRLIEPGRGDFLLESVEGGEVRGGDRGGAEGERGEEGRGRVGRGQGAATEGAGRRARRVGPQGGVRAHPPPGPSQRGKALTRDKERRGGEVKKCQEFSKKRISGIL